MLDPAVIAVADGYWAAHCGCLPEELHDSPLRVLENAGELSDYRGIFALFRNGRVTLSAPADVLPEVRRRLMMRAEAWSPQEMEKLLAPWAARVIGPAFIGYAAAVPEPPVPVRALAGEEAPLIEALENACDPTEWEHGGSGARDVCSAVMADGEIAALAGYEIWGGRIAHISIVTHPAFRGRGYGRSAVSHLARRALADGLVPQYRTLEANLPSIRIAESLGFRSYATSLAVRLKATAC